MNQNSTSIFFGSLLCAGVFFIAGCGLSGGGDPFERGEKSFKSQDYQESRESFITALETEGLSSLRKAEIYNYLGVIGGLQGNQGDAEEAFEQAQRYQQDYFDPIYNRALLNLEAGKLSLAEEQFSEASSLEGNNAFALEWLGHLALQRGNNVEARRHYFEAMNKVGNSPRILTALANVEWGENKPSDAVTYLNQAMEMNPDYAPALFNLARIYDEAFQDTDQANAFYQQYLSVAQDTRRVEFARARIAGRIPGESQVAEPQVTQSQEPEQTVLSTEERITKMVTALLARAEQRRDAGAVNQALNYCLQAAARSKSNPQLQEKALRRATDLCFDKGKGHYELGRFLESQGRNREALASYKQAATLEPNKKYIHLDLANLATSMEEHDVALTSLRTVSNIDPDDADVAWKLASLLEKQGLKEKAAKAYKLFNQKFPGDTRTSTANNRLKALRPTPTTQVSLRSSPRSGNRNPGPPSTGENASDNALKAFNRATAYLQRKDLNRAIFFFKRAIELDPYLVSAYYNLGLTYRQKGDLPRASDMFESVVELKPNMVDAYYNQALVLHDLKREQEAVNVLKVLTRKQPDYAPAYYLAAVIFGQYPQQYDLARRYYTQFVQLAEVDDPYVPVARKWLAENR